MAEINLFWDPLSDNILQERDETGTVTAEYTTEPGLYGNLISQNRQGEERQFHFDAIGSTRALTDDSEEVVDTLAYSAFGEITERTGNTTTPFQYVGRNGYYHDSAAREVNVRWRRIQPDNARWLSVDPSELLAEYRYAANRPVMLVDPSGLLSQWIVPYGLLDDKIRQWLPQRNPYNGPCRSYSLLTEWEPAADERNGLIIQLVEVKEKVSPCSPRDDLDSTLCPPPVHYVPLPGSAACTKYFELWRVYDGRVYKDHPFAEEPFHFPKGGGNPIRSWQVEAQYDFFIHFGHSVPTQGRETKSGSAIFLDWDELKRPANATHFDWLRMRFTEGAVAGAGYLYSTCHTDTDDAVWRALTSLAGVDKVVTKALHKTWDCCSDDTRKSKLVIQGVTTKQGGSGDSLDELSESVPPETDRDLRELWNRRCDC